MNAVVVALIGMMIKVRPAGFAKVLVMLQRMRVKLSFSLLPIIKVVCCNLLNASF